MFINQQTNKQTNNKGQTTMAISANNLIALNNAWYNNACPYSEMENRTSEYVIEDVYGLSPYERCVHAFGAAIANLIYDANGNIKVATSSIDKALFSILNALLIRQKYEIVFPVKAGEEFFFRMPGAQPEFFLPGEVLIKQIGLQNLLRKEAKGYLQEVYDFIGDLPWLHDKQDHLSDLCQMAGKYNLPANKVGADIVETALLSFVVAKHHPELKCLASENARHMIQDLFGIDDIPNNLIFVSGWVRQFDFHATFEDVIFVCKELQKATTKGKTVGIKVVENENDYSIIFDDEHEFIVTVDGVWQKSRMRRFNNLLFIYGGEFDSEGSGRVKPNSAVLLNSFGTFLYGLVCLSAQHLRAGSYSQLVKELVSGNLVPLVADDEVGAGDADRQQYEKYVTIEKAMPIHFPFEILNGKVIFKGASRLAELTISQSCIDYVALRTFNLVRMPKGQLIDGRMSCVQLPHILPQLQTQFIRDTFQENFGFGDDEVIASWAKKEFSLHVSLSSPQVFEYLKQNLVVAASSKLAKLIKRTAMYASLVGELEGGESRGFIPFGQQDISVNNWCVESIISEHAIFPAGVAVYWGEKPVLKVPHTSSQTPNIVPTKKEGDSVVVDYPHTAPVLRNGWWEITMSEVVYLNRGDVYGSVPYMVGSENYFHYLVNKTDECQLVSIRWRQAKVFGNDQALQILTTVLTPENQIKARNNVKAMMSRYNPECIHHELNGELEGTLHARAIFFADTNKWLDLLMQNVDVAALTAIKNQDKEGLELIKAANKAAGVNTVDYLEWSPMLALLGTYKPIINWFETKYGKDIWFFIRGLIINTDSVYFLYC